LVSGLACPTGLATDPLSGDLFVSNKCSGGAIMRVGPLSNPHPAASTYTATRADGLTFAPDGTLFSASEDSRVDQIAGTDSASPGSSSKLADVPVIDGIAYAPAADGNPAYLVVDRNNGEIDRLDLNGALTPLLTGGSRGDLVT